MAKYKVGQMVRFTLGLNGRPDADKWLEGAKEGKGVIIDRQDFSTTNSTLYLYSVKVTNPSDWEKGHDCNGRLTGSDANKGYGFFGENGLRPAEPTRTSAPTKSIAREKSDDDRTRAFFMKTKEEPDVLCPNPGCHGAKTEKIFFSVVCPICGWTSH